MMRFKPSTRRRAPAAPRLGARLPRCAALGLLLGLLCGQAGIAGAAAGSRTAWGFTPFPYDFTLEAVNRVYDIVENDATLFAVHRDDGVPWQEALEDKPFPKKVREEWQARVGHIKPHHKVYVGLAPLSTDRESLAEISEGSKTRKSFRKNALNSAEVKQAYTNYVRRAIDTFDPDYLNIGIEVGELTSRNERRWHDFEELFAHVKAAVKAEHPEIQVGISFGLQSLMEPRNAELSRPIIERSDFVGISFYPYMSAFHEALGSHRLEPPPAQWMKPLDWLRAYTDKPIAICETGYTTETARLSKPRLEMTGNAELQKRYLLDLAAVAARDDYLFVAWFLPVDYEALSRRAGFEKGSVMRLWENIGLFDAEVRPKPAWSAWQQIIAGQVDAASAPAPVAPTPRAQAAAPAAGGAAARYTFDIADAKRRFKGSWHDKVRLSDETPNGAGQSMRWSFEYGDRFQWLQAQLERGDLAGASGMRIAVKGAQDSFVVVLFEESSGEAYWGVVPVKTDWNTVDLDFAEFQIDTDKPKKNGRFEPDDVVRVTLADARGFEGARGKQKVWVTDWTVY